MPPYACAGKVVGASKVARDITERKRAAESLAQQKCVREMFDQIQDEIERLDTQHRLKVTITFEKTDDKGPTSDDGPEPGTRDDDNDGGPIIGLILTEPPF